MNPKLLLLLPTLIHGLKQMSPITAREDCQPLQINIEPSTFQVLEVANLGLNFMNKIK